MSAIIGCQSWDAGPMAAMKALKSGNPGFDLQVEMEICLKNTMNTANVYLIQRKNIFIWAIPCCNKVSQTYL